MVYSGLLWFTEVFLCFTMVPPFFKQLFSRDHYGLLCFRPRLWSRQRDWIAASVWPWSTMRSSAERGTGLAWPSCESDMNGYDWRKADTWTHPYNKDIQWYTMIYNDIIYNGTMMYNDIQWYTMIYTWYTLLYTDIQWYTMICNDIQWYPMICNDIQWYTMIYNDIQWYTLIYIDIHWYTLIYIDIHWYTLIYIDIHWYTLIYIDIRWYTLIYIDIHWYTCIHACMHACIHTYTRKCAYMYIIWCTHANKPLYSMSCRWVRSCQIGSFLGSSLRTDQT